METQSFKPFETQKVKKYIASRVFLTIFTLAGLLCMFSALWYASLFGDIGVESVLFTVLAGFAGVQGGMVASWIFSALVPSLVLTAAFFFLFLKVPYILYKGRDAERFDRNRIICALLTVVIILSSFASAFHTVGLDSFAINLLAETKLYENEYKDPETTKITFPEKKRNLIYIYMESMETTFFSKDKGGALDENALQPLYTLAQQNINFSQNEGVGGGQTVFGTTWTSAAMMAQTSGIPMRSPLSLEAIAGNEFFDSTTTLSDILLQNGYNQALMVGSNSEYGGRKDYYSQHGTDKIYDIFTAYDDGVVPEGYFEWWGMEDKYLYSYAKQKITEMSQGSEPFALTMLTVDTHHVGGFKCSECKDEFSEQYTNALACSARQVSEFVEWIKEQDFYENTTIIISGDHYTMDNGFIKRNVNKEYIRRVYNCFINAVGDAKNSKNREFTTLDMFPTTLSAIGCEIEANRLGLGTDLFSGEKTLCEKYGYKKFNSEIQKHSDYYIREFD